ncbi:MAG: hypothetical protein KatS3mg085_465 [Candidatus Dojkabacteria bacterium]|nr:MAG: hypothetical protein KatS3mg085_465 [Candidatus Dojkabacteria bacterium]
MKEPQNIYPYIALNIINFKPTITFHPAEDMSRQLTIEEVDLYEIIVDVAKRLDLIDDVLKKIKDKMILMDNLLEIAKSAADISKVEKYPDISQDNNEFEIKPTIEKLLQNALANKSGITKMAELSPELESEIIRDENIDIFASILESLYSILIANTILAASQIGVGKIKLNDEHKMERLLERMAQELQKLDIDFLLD